MNIPTQTELTATIEAFCARHKMAETRFGREAVNNPAFVRGLRDGKSPTLDTLNKITSFMARTDAAAATAAKLAAPIEGPPQPIAEENELPFGAAPVKDTGASSPISSPTSGRPPSPAASDSSRCSTTATPSSFAAEEESLVRGPSLPTEAACLVRGPSLPTEAAE